MFCRINSVLCADIELKRKQTHAEIDSSYNRGK